MTIFAYKTPAPAHTHIHKLTLYRFITRRLKIKLLVFNWLYEVRSFDPCITARRVFLHE